MFFTPRTTKPTKGNKYYMTKSVGGYSSAIVGKPTDSDCNVLANCVGYAYGRFHEICNSPSMQYLTPVNAENFIQYADKTLVVNQTPKVGAVAVWQKGATLKSSDGAGHVAIVEKVISNTQIVTSESGYGSSKPFWTQTRNKGNDGNWGQKGTYKFLGFIHQPVELQSILSRGDKGLEVKTLQENLNKAGYNVSVDGSFGPATQTAVKKLQQDYKLTADGIYGEKTDEALKQAITENTKPTGVEDLTFILDGVEVTAWGTNLGNQNYIRMVDLEKLGIVKSVKYNSTKKLPEVKTK